MKTAAAVPPADHIQVIATRPERTWKPKESAVAGWRRPIGGPACLSYVLNRLPAMSTLWTPSGEHPVDRDRSGDAESSAGSSSGSSAATARGDSRSPGARAGESGRAPQGTPPDRSSPEDEQHLEELRRQLANAPADVVVANHCFGLFELAGVYLSQAPPKLEQARLAIDAFGAVIEGVAGRLGETESTLRDALAQIRMAFVQISGAEQAAGGSPSTSTSGNGAEHGGS